jgi:hypothetical protein
MKKYRYRSLQAILILLRHIYEQEYQNPKSFNKKYKKNKISKYKIGLMTVLL